MVIYTIGNKKITTSYDTLDNSFFVECIDSPSPSLKNIKLYIKEQSKIKKVIKTIRPDIILFTSKHIWNFMMLPYLKMKKIKVFHVFHDPIGHAGTSVSRGVVVYNKVVSKFLSGIIVHSQISYDNTIKYIKPKCKVKKVPLGEKKWLEYHMPEKFKHRLLMFGRVSTYKGCEFIPILADELIKQGVDCKIVVAGKALDDVDETTLKRIHDCTNVEFRNEFIPENELNDYYENSDATLILHKSISQSGVIIDAYRHGHPILCFDIDGISEFITEDTAFVAPKYNIQALTKNIIQLYDSGIEKYRDMSYKAYIYGKNIFSDAKMAMSILDFINEV